MAGKNFYFALATLIGTTVGAGIFGIPYVISKSGIIPGFFYFFILGGAVLLLHLFFGEIVLRTKEKHRLIGYTQKYLGKREKIFITISTILGLTGALLAYIILGGDFLKIILSSWISVDSFYLSLFLWVLLVYFVFRGIKLIAQAEFLMNIIFIFIIFLIFLFALPKFSFQNFTLLNLKHLFLPYGVILFAFAAWAALPEMIEILKTEEERKNYKKIIILASIVVFILYLIFTLAVIGVSGKNTSEEALLGLIPFLGQKIIFWGALFGLIAVVSSFLILGDYLKNSLAYDYKIPKFWSAFIAGGFPLILFLIGFRGFIATISFVGILIGVIEGAVIVLIFKKAKILGDRNPEYNFKIPSFLIYLLIVIFILGAVSQIFYYVK